VVTVLLYQIRPMARAMRLFRTRWTGGPAPECGSGPLGFLHQALDEREDRGRKVAHQAGDWQDRGTGELDNLPVHHT
jgi:hypothetical protein